MKTKEEAEQGGAANAYPRHVWCLSLRFGQIPSLRGNCGLIDFGFFYSVDGNQVKVVAGGHKEHHEFFIRGKKVEL